MLPCCIIVSPALPSSFVLIPARSCPSYAVWRHKTESSANVGKTLRTFTVQTFAYPATYVQYKSTRGKCDHVVFGNGPDQWAPVRRNHNNTFRGNQLAGVSTPRDNPPARMMNQVLAAVPEGPFGFSSSPGHTFTVRPSQDMCRYWQGQALTHQFPP